MQEKTLDELDRSILHALQISPRASWTTVGRVLGVDAVTATRRWDRLRSTGSAWTTCYPGVRLIDAGFTAYVEIDVQSGRMMDVSRALAAYPQVVTVEHLAGGRDVLAMVLVQNLGALSELVTEHIAALPGVARTRAALATRVFSEGSRWRLRSLTPAQQRQLTRPATDQSRAEVDEYDHRLITALSRDARAPAVELARQTGLSAPNVRRRIAGLVHRGDAVLRCEIARGLTEWPVAATLWASVPPGEIDKVAQGLRALPELRMCSSVTGPHNLLFTLWLNSVADLARLETLLAERLPQLHLVDRAVTLRMVKLMGQLLDERGHATACVPIDPWLPPRSPGQA
ncbi:DNA-binding transcriptional regulator, Lrp family [Saccharopolyspora antimicrobica]|uniref:DNA-binding Lrp family transcriptional regulator n=1 Tax=Saccharopolyspora antimicrobica TaxID=455193 RepID=A0A1I4VDU5_9PSEU|nr:DNA-binding Lrp family transcriptional regulator [Saccharopolyspora antimicrobica]SFM99404.1 DNA-binding transcriptional regulator, Lrp family [Saccharopolyspora antimicrobica]